MKRLNLIFTLFICLSTFAQKVDVVNAPQNPNCISGNCINGYGKYKLPSGGTVTGFFTNAKLNGYGSLDLVSGDGYLGNFVDGKKEGYGIYQWKSTNTQYYGEWKNDKINGYGYIVTNGKTTQGGIYTDAKLTTDLFTDYNNKKITGDNCKGNCSNGYGSKQYDNGDIYVGFFINGNTAKVGARVWKSTNTSYTGQFNSNGEIHGLGMYIDATSMYIGGVAKGKITGLGLKTDKKTYKETYGEFVDGMLVKDYSIASNTSSSSTINYTTNSPPKESCISGNCTDGYGKLKTKDGSTITGFFKYSQPNGYGIEVYDNVKDYYQGTFKNGLRDGYGYYEWSATGQKYIGLWKEGLQHGYGYYSHKGIVIQAGYYEKGKQTRNLLTQDYSNKILKGNCIGDCYNGFGSIKYSNNDAYHGFFVNGEKSYIGAYIWASGNVYTGEYYNGSNTGEGTAYYGSDKSTYHGAFVKGIRQGLGIHINNSKTTESKGYWENGFLKTTY